MYIISYSATHHFTVAVFSFTSTSYAVGEHAGPALKVVELGGCDLSFAIDVTVNTVGGGSAIGTVEAIVVCMWLQIIIIIRI